MAGSGHAARLRHNGRHVGHLTSALIEDHTIIVPDLRGLGLSAKPDGGYDKRNQAADIVGVLDALGVGKFELVTHDIGIMVATQLPPPTPTREPMGCNRCTAARHRPLEQIVMDPAMWHFGFGGPDMERLVAGRERIYLDRFWNTFPGTETV